MSGIHSNPVWRYTRILLSALTLAISGGAWISASAAIDPLTIEGPVAAAYAVQAPDLLVATVTTALNLTRVREEDEGRESLGLPPRFAIPESVWLTPEDSGTWEDLDEQHVIWRARIIAAGAVSLNLGFTGYWLPEGARLSIYPTDVAGPGDRRGQPVFSAEDNEDHGQLWTPVILADDIVVELVLPRAERHNYRLELTAINRGYRYFGETFGAKSGPCNIDVVCSEGDDWRQEINSVAAVSTGGSIFCTGVMLNNTAADGRPLFLTANHCNINLSTAASLVVYWNFQSPVCGDQGGGVVSDFMSGSVFLASSSTSDFTLVEMDDPVDPAFGVTFAGWNRSSDDPTSAIAIHHPTGDEKSISFENDPTSTTSYLQTQAPGNGTHIRVEDWDIGTTEPGSSGSPLFDQNHYVVGQLHGGYAACGNDLADWYGRFSVSWEGNGTPSTRLRDHLDPGGTGLVTLGLYEPTGGIPDLSHSIASSAFTGPGFAVLLNRPDGGGSAFTAARTLAGPQDATVTLALRDGLQTPIPNFPFEDMWLESGDGGMAVCVGGTVADANTNAAGMTSWVAPMAAGGWSQAATVVVIAGSTLMSGDLPINYNSADISGDGFVNLADIPLLASDFYGSYAFRSDLFFDGNLNLSDVVIAATAIGVSCP